MWIMPQNNAHHRFHQDLAGNDLRVYARGYSNVNMIEKWCRSVHYRIETVQLTVERVGNDQSFKRDEWSQTVGGPSVQESLS